MTHKEHLNLLLADGNLKQVIKELLEATDKANTIIMLSGRYSRNEKGKDSMDLRDYQIELNKISNALVAYIEDEYEDDGRYKWESISPEADTSSPKPNNLRPKILKMLQDGFDDSGLQLFCFSYFDEVYSNFAATQPKNDKIMALIKYCEQYLKIPELLSTLQKERPEMYKIVFHEN